MRQVLEIVSRVAPTDAAVLVQGESGTGKELIARAIHQNSKRKDAAFIPINCGALPENLLESELFGHVKGAFTGAHQNKKGLIEEADGGTLFLDEIG
jgi:transcriptional regulator with PAS, ATPase and Fis domain